MGEQVTGGQRPLTGVQIYNFDVTDPFGAGRIASLIDELAIEMTVAPLWWGRTETAPRSYDWSALDWWRALSDVLPQMPRRIWCLFPVHMNERGPLPPDLQEMPFDSAEMLERFEAFVDAAASQGAWQAEGDIVVVGNEIDTWAQSYPAEVDAFLTFSDAAAAALRRGTPGVRVVNTCTADALNAPGGPDLVRELNRSMDLVAFQWYDNGPDGGVRGLTEMSSVMKQWLHAAAGKPVLLSEIGLPSSPDAGSSEEMQVQRVEEIFDVVQSLSREECEGVVWLAVNDWDRERMREWVAKQFPIFDGAQTFLGFLTSLGLRRADGTAKPAYDAWARLARRHPF
jgi:hypothetical protein